MLAGMSGEDLLEWQAYAALEPFGEERADLRAGIIAATVANGLAGGRGKRFEARDFMPQFDRPRPTGAELGAKFALFAKAHNAAERRKKVRR